MDEPNQRSQVFLVHIWLEQLGEGNAEWRGRVQSAAGNHVRYFRDWETLTNCVRAMLPPTRESIDPSDNVNHSGKEKT